MSWNIARLKTLRRAYGFTQAQFAELVGVSTATITYWETGGPIPRMACNLLDRLEKEQPQNGELQPA
jgi:DNA-binding transcriptional regulator YiaG